MASGDCPGEHVPNRCREAFDLVAAERISVAERRELGGMKDLVRVGVPDAGNHRLVGENALERPALVVQDARQPGG